MIAGRAPRIGGGPWHAGRALAALGADARVIAKCGEPEATAYARELEALGLPFDLVVGETTTAFSFSYDESGVRTMHVDALGEPWREEELHLDGVEWLQVVPLLRSQVDLELIEVPHVLLDAQGLVRVPALGPLRLDDDFDRAQLRHLSMLKLADEEAAVVGDVDVPEVIVTHGVRGATVNGVHVQAEPVECDPTGAGDMFAAAYLVARAGGADPVAAARGATSVVAELLR
ncbi:MAG TPA: PfkB family carbohydrate kinase [Gaiellaceae bacterium]|nr:PfkB family carbohydrate kinase [Gaiellaceae bacterium]